HNTRGYRPIPRSRNFLQYRATPPAGQRAGQSRSRAEETVCACIFFSLSYSFIFVIDGPRHTGHQTFFDVEPKVIEKGPIPFSFHGKMAMSEPLCIGFVAILGKEVHHGGEKPVHP